MCINLCVWMNNYVFFMCVRAYVRVFVCELIVVFVVGLVYFDALARLCVWVDMPVCAFNSCDESCQWCRERSHLPCSVCWVTSLESMVGASRLEFALQSDISLLGVMATSAGCAASVAALMLTDRWEWLPVRGYQRRCRQILYSCRPNPRPVGCHGSTKAFWSSGGTCHWYGTKVFIL